MTRARTAVQLSNQEARARYTQRIGDPRSMAQRLPCFDSADERIRILLNRRAGTGSLVRLVQRRDRLIHADHDDGMARRWPPVRVALVRHPVDRMVSAFFDMWIDPIDGLAELCTRAAHVDVDKLSFQFDAFIDFAAMALSGLTACCDTRLQSQVTLIDQLDVDHVGRLERFEEEVRVIEQIASIRLLPVEPWEYVHLNRSGAQRSGFRPTAAQRRKIRCLYESDFTAWGYDDASSGRPTRGIRIVRSTDSANRATAP